MQSQEPQKESVQQPENIVDKAHRAAERLEKANFELAQLLARQEKIMAQNVISGVAEAGKPAPTKTQEDKDKEEVNKWLTGTGLKV